MRIYLPSPCFIEELIGYMREALGRIPSPDEVREACRSIPEPDGTFSVEESREKELRFIEIPVEKENLER